MAENSLLQDRGRMIKSRLQGKIESFVHAIMPPRVLQQIKNFVSSREVGKKKKNKTELVNAEMESHHCVNSGKFLIREEITPNDIEKSLLPEVEPDTSVVDQDLAIKAIVVDTERRSSKVDTSILGLSEELHKRIFGQDQAISEVVYTIRKSTIGFSSSCRPIGTFLFVGPMGVGKQALAKAIASCLCKTEEALVIVDMDDEMSVYDEKLRLAEFVRARPNAVIMLRKIDKVPTGILNRFLKMFDDGEGGTDSYGRHVSFANTVLIMIPSYDGSECLLKTEDSEVAKDVSYETKKKRVKEAAKSIYGPKLTYLVDEFIIFHRLDQYHIRNIVRIQLEGWRKRLAAERRMKIQVSESAVLALGVIAGRYKDTPAWFVKDAIQENILNTLANGILRDEIKDGDTIFVDTKGPEQKIVLKSG